MDNHNKQHISNLLEDAAELLVLDEVSILGIIGLLNVGLISFAVIYLKIASLVKKHKEKKEMNTFIKKATNKAIEMSEIAKYYNDIKDKIEFISYDPIAINMINDYSKLWIDSIEELKSIDKEFQAIKTIDEWEKKKEYFKKKYTTYNKKYDKLYELLEKKYNDKNTSDKWIDDKKIIPILDKYINLDLEWKNLDGDDWWEAVDIFNTEAFRKFYKTNPSSAESIDYDMYKIYSMSTYSICEKIYKNLYTKPFKYIKLKFKARKN